MLGEQGERVGQVLKDQLLSSLSGIPQELSQPFSSLGEKNCLGITIFPELQTKIFMHFKASNVN